MQQFVTRSQFVATFAYFHPLIKQMIKTFTIIIINIILNEWEFGLIWIVGVNFEYFLNESPFLGWVLPSGQW